MKKIFSIFAAVLFAGSMMADAITCAEAREKALAGNTDVVTIRGYVTEIVEGWQEQYKNVSFWMADTKDGGQVFEAFRVTCNAEADAPTKGALVEVTGKLTKYTPQGGDPVPETEKGGSFTIIEPGEEVVPDVTPAVPEGVLTCADAKILAANATDPTADNKNVEVQANVKIRGFVTFAYDLKEGKQSAWIADKKSASAGEVQGYYLEVAEAVVKGDYVEIEGKFVKFFKAGKDGKADEIILEVTDGTMKKVEPLTGVENTVLTQKAQKVMIDGVVYIMRDNKLFNIQGAQVR